MRHLKQLFVFALMTLFSVGQVWGAEEVAYTLTPASGSNNSYAGNCDVEIDGITWNLTGNSQQIPWRIGGNKTNCAGVDREVYSKTAMSDAITKVELAVGAGSSSGITINSLTLVIASDADFNTVIDEVTETYAASSTITFQPTSPLTKWATGAYYKFVFNLTVTANSGNKYVEFTEANFYKEAGGTPTCATPTFTPNGGSFAGSTSVTLSTTTDGASIYYTMGDAPADPTSSSTLYENPINVTATTTIKAIAVKSGLDNSPVAEKTFTKLEALTTMDAIFAAATTAGSTATDVLVTFNNWVVTGVKSSNAYLTDGTKGLIIYASGHGFAVGNVLSGTAACKVQLYNGSAELTNLTSTTDGLTVTTGGTASVNVLDAEGIAGLSGVNTGSLIKISGECTQESSKYYIGGVQLYSSLYSFTVSAGTSYECTGVYVQYNTTKEVLPRSADDIVVSSSIAVTGVNLTESTAEVEAGSTVTLHASVEPSTATNKTIVWSVQSGSAYASVANGIVTGIAAGEAVIRAASDEDASLYDECTVTITAADPTKHVVTFDATVDKGESPLSKSNITFTCSNGVLNNETEYRLYKNSTNTFACSVGNIIKIEFTGVSGNPVSGFEDPEVGTLVTDGNDGVWTGNAASVSFVASGAQVRATEIKVTYKEDSRAEAGLAWDPADDIELTVGGAFTAPTLLNPNSIDAAEITIASSNTDVATVTAGVVELVADATGTTTISATFAGNDDYKPATVSYNITVNAAPVVLTDYYEKVTSTADIVEGTYLIVYEDASVAFNGALGYDNDHKIDVENNTIDVDITSDHKIGVTSATEAATFYIDPTAGSIQAACGKYIGVGGYSNGLAVSDDASAYDNALSIDASGNAVIAISTTSGDMTLRYNAASNQARFRYYKSGQQDIQLYKLHGEVVKADPGISWDPSSYEMTLSSAITPGDYPEPVLNIQADLGANPLESITLSSDNESLATINKTNDGQINISWVPDVSGTVHFTAAFAGNDTYKAVTAVCTIKVNPANSIYVSPSLNVNFGSVLKDATVDDKTITVTLTGVDNATATLGGDHPEVFSISPAALTASGDITISASSATAGTFNATLTISDDASAADPKVVALKIIVTEPASEETAISTTTKWVVAANADLVDGAEVLIIGVDGDDVYAMGEQGSNNRAAVLGTLDASVFTPGANTMSFTLEDQGDGTFALKTSNDKYLYAAASGSNHMKTQATVNDNAKWTLTTTSAVAESSSNRNVMQFNSGSSIFSCYGSASQKPIQFYVPQSAAPAPAYETVRDELVAGNYYTVCYNKTMTAIQGATLWSFVGKDAGMAYIEQATAPYPAGKPYILYATADKLEAVLEGDAVDETALVANNGLHGTFSNLVQEHLDGLATTAGADLYLVIGNQLRRATGAGTGSNSLNAYRAYVIVDEITGGKPSAAPGRNVRSMPMKQDTATGMDELNASENPVKMIIDGKLYILRGEKMYNANGQLVK